MKDKIIITKNGDGKESVYGEEEPTTNYIISVAFETVRKSKYFTYYFIKIISLILFMKLNGKPVNSYFEAVIYIDMSYGSENVIMCVSRNIAITVVITVR